MSVVEDDTPVITSLLLGDGLAEINGVAETYRNVIPRLPSHILVVPTSCQQLEWPQSVRLPVGRVVDLSFAPDVPVLLPRVRDVVGAIRSLNADVVHVTAPGALGWVGLTAARLTATPVLASFHTMLGAYLLARTGRRLISRGADRLMGAFYRAATSITAPTRTAADVIARLAWTDADEVHILPQGVEHERFARPIGAVAHRQNPIGTATVRVVCVTRVTPEKRLDRLISAIPLVRSAVPVELVIAGDGPSRGHLEQLAPPGVRFTGWRTGADLLDILHSADIFALPSPTETCGQALLEAQAAGLPCVVSGQGAAREAIDPGRTGLIVERENPLGFARALSYLASESNTMRRMGSEARLLARKRSWADGAAILAALYTRLSRERSASDRSSAAAASDR